jgi:hypothetical protein
MPEFCILVFPRKLGVRSEEIEGATFLWLCFFIRGLGLKSIMELEVGL